VSPGFEPGSAGEAYCYLTTTGRRTGNLHTIEIWFAMPENGRALYVLSGGDDRSDWVRNLRVDPRVTVRVGSAAAEEHAGTARPVEVPAEDEAARKLLAAKYQGWHAGEHMSHWARTALCIAIDPE